MNSMTYCNGQVAFQILLTNMLFNIDLNDIFSRGESHMIVNVFIYLRNLELKSQCGDRPAQRKLSTWIAERLLINLP